MNGRKLKLEVLYRMMSSHSSSKLRIDLPGISGDDHMSLKLEQGLEVLVSDSVGPDFFYRPLTPCI